MSELTHIDKAGKARMVDVSSKPPTEREAVAKGTVRMSPSTLRLILDNEVKKGDVLGVARIAGIMAAKKAGNLIPLCHPLNITSVDITLKPGKDDSASLIEITATVRVTGVTGVEMEAMTAVAVSALTIYDMCKAVDRDMVLGDIRLIKKSGGKSGTYLRKE